MTTILRLEHSIQDFDAWKQMFDSDPANREASGVRRYRILRPADDPNYVMIDTEFDTAGEAEEFLAKMRKVWAGAGATVSANQTGRISELVETGEYPPAGTAS